MGANENAPVIIKRKKVIAGGGHHGGAWKVAYADFVTAMMAFFLLMWLLNATTEKQRKGIADYFTPTIAVNRISGGGDGSLGGDSVFSEETFAQNGIGASSLHVANASGGDLGTLSGVGVDDTLAALEQSLMGQGGEVLDVENAMRQIATRITDQGLVVELFSLEGSPLFEMDGVTPTPLLEALMGAVADVFSQSPNPVAVEGHSRSYEVVLRTNPTWDISVARAEMAKKALGRELGDQRIARVVGHADRRLADTNPMAVRNERMELILLRSLQ